MGKYGHILISMAFVSLISCKKDKTPFPLEPAFNDLEHGWYTEDCSNSWPDHWVDSFNLYQLISLTQNHGKKNK